jgi:RNA polymerase sigma factor (sigma-70 family)
VIKKGCDCKRTILYCNTQDIEKIIHTIETMKNDAQRFLLICRVVNGMTQKETAKIMNYTVRQIRRIETKAIKKVNEIIESV